MATTTAEQLDDKVSRRKLIGDVPSILGAFEAAWAPRWKKHDEVPSEEWQTTRDFLKAALPSRQTSFPPLTPELWLKTINRKRKGAAIGPDRVSKQDLLNMPPAILGQLLQLIRAIPSHRRYRSRLGQRLGFSLISREDSREISETRIVPHTTVHRACVWMFRRNGRIHHKSCKMFQYPPKKCSPRHCQPCRDSG